MKKILLIILSLTSFIAYSQAVKKNNFGIAIGTQKGMVARKTLEGAPGYHIERGINIGIDYFLHIHSKLKLESGLTWYKNHLSVTPAFYPGIDMTPKKHEIQLIYVPLFLRINVAKYFFINGGLIADFDITRNKYLNNQSGLGAGIGLGMEFSITKKLMLQINPYGNFHGLLQANSANNPERLLDNGIRIGIVTKL